VCADVEARRRGLEEVVAGIVRTVKGSGEGEERCPALLSWAALAAEPGLAAGFVHLVALDPPLSAAGEALLAAAPGPPEGFGHLAWGEAESDFALAIARRDLDLRPTVTEIYRDLRMTGPCAGHQLEKLLRGAGPHPRPAALCARAARVLTELGLVALEPGAIGYSARVLDSQRTELDRSPTYRAAAAALAEAGAYLGKAAADRAAA
jgi:hypothetical protein